MVSKAVLILAGKASRSAIDSSKTHNHSEREKVDAFILFAHSALPMIRIGPAFLAVVLVLMMSEANSAEPEISLPRITHIHGVAFDRNDTSHVYIGSGHGFFRVGPDGSLERFATDRPDFKGFAVHPSQPTKFVASGHPGGGGNLEFIATEDAGRSWSRLNEAAPAPAKVHFMAISALNPDVVYGTHGGLQVSRDAGATWTIEGKIPNGVLDIAASATTEDTIYVGTPQGLMVSRNAGKSWTNAFKSKKKHPATMVEITPDGTLFTFSHGRRLITFDEATRKGKILASAKKFDGALIHLAVDPNNKAHLVAVTQYMKLLVSEDGGKTWGKFVR